MPSANHLAPDNSSVYFSGTNISYEQLRGLQGFSPLNGEVTAPLSFHLSGFHYPRPEPRVSVAHRKGGGIPLFFLYCLSSSQSSRVSSVMNLTLAQFEIKCRRKIWLQINGSDNPK